MNSPISNPGIPPVKPPSQPTVGMGEETQPKPFAPEALKRGPQPTPTDGKPSPMQAAKEMEERKYAQTQPMKRDELNSTLERINERLEQAKDRLQGPERANLTKDHQAALKTLTDKLTPDVKQIAQATESTYAPPALKKGGDVLGHVINWIDGSQRSMKSALNFLSQKHDLNPADFLKLQYSVQRASQRTELFASVIGSTVSGLKTLMSTQLG